MSVPYSDSELSRLREILKGASSMGDAVALAQRVRKGATVDSLDKICRREWGTTAARLVMSNVNDSGPEYHDTQREMRAVNPDDFDPEMLPRAEPITGVMPVVCDEASSDVGVERIIFWPDTHRPHHSEAAVQLALAVARHHFAPVAPSDRRVVILGDYADFYAVSFHSKDPARKLSFADEVADVNIGLDEIDALDAGHRDFVSGNHEFRLQRYLADKSPELVGLDTLNVPDLFRLSERGWSYTPYMDSLRIGKLFITHDEGNAGQYAHIKARGSFEHNVIIGHTHRLAMSYQGNAVGETHVGVMSGWLGDYEAIDYVHRVKARQWTHGVVLGTHDRATGVVFLQPVPFIGGRALVGGDIVEAA